MASKFIVLFAFFTLINSEFCIQNCKTCEISTTCNECVFGYTSSRTECRQEYKDETTAIILGVVFGIVGFIAIAITVICCCSQSRSCYWKRCCGIKETYLDRPINIYGQPVDYLQGDFIAQQIANGVPIENPNNFATTNQFLLSPTPQPITAPMMMPNMITSPFRNFNTERDTCTICLSTGTNIQLLPCTHQFHSQCISEWCSRNRICPTCNTTNFRLRVLCSRCFQFNEQVTLCPVGCQKPDHNECFMMRNQNRLICRNCTSGMGAMTPGMYHPGSQQMVIPNVPNSYTNLLQNGGTMNNFAVYR